MQAAAKAAKANRPAVEGKPDSVPAPLAPDVRRVLDLVRQDYLDALPIAAAMIGVEEGVARIDCANDHFRLLAAFDERLGERRIDHVPLLAAGPVGSRLAAFLKGRDPAVQFETDDGRNIGGRYYAVRLARLRRVPGFPLRCLVTLIDKTVQVETERSLRSGMLRDNLTGLPNRLAFNEEVERLLEDPDFREGGHAVLAVDLTRFSRVNECIGAIAGDELLITFARRLVSALRPSDVLARTSGDEFGILLRLDRGISDALRAAERIKAVLTLPFRLSELEIRVDCAIGCAILSHGVSSADEVVRNAQLALKRAKALGTTQVYEPTQAQAVRRRFSIETELRRAIEAEELALAFQPVIDLESGAVAGFEALARWRDPESGAIPPSDFIPVAEESGLIVQLGRWALESATRTLVEWDEAHGAQLPLSMSVNLSAIQISRDDVGRMVAQALADSGLDGRRLTLELTESAIIQDPDRATQVLRALKKLDVKVAMDDFGTGYTSLAYLQRLPIDILKIDRSFVADMLAGGDSRAIVRAIHSLATALGMETTAEGIDSEELAAALRDLGCTYGQGYLFSQPLPAADAFAYWRERSAAAT